MLFTDRRVAAVAATWYVAFLLAMKPGIVGAITSVIVFPITLVLCAAGFLFLPANLLRNLHLELSGVVGAVYHIGFLVSVVLLHLWLYWSWRWSVLALVAVILCASSYGCSEHFPMR